MVSMKKISLLVAISISLTACNNEDNSALEKYYIVPMHGNSSAATTMVDLASGKSLLNETDISMNGLRFSRQFTSQGLGSSLLGGWRHNLSSHIGKKAINYKDWKGVKSQKFSDVGEACILGWNEIKSDAYHGQLLNASASFDDGLCKIYADKELVATLPVLGTDNSINNSVQVLIRQDGTYHTFYRQFNQWINVARTGFDLEEVGDGWQVRTPADTVETYDDEGKLSSVESNGQITTLTYNSNSQLKHITDFLGRSLTLNYQDDRLTSISGADGTTRYNYDSNGNLTQVIKVDDSESSYEYTSDYVSKVNNAEGHTIASFEYDDIGRTVRSARANGSHAKIINYQSDNVEVLDESTQAIEKYVFSIIKGSPKLVRSTDVDNNIEYREYDNNGYLRKVRAKDGSTREMQYNDRGLQTSVTQNSHSHQHRKTIKTEWHPKIKKPIKYIEGKKVTKFEYNNSGLLIKKITGSLGISGNRSLINRQQDSNDIQETSYRYNHLGQIEEILLPNGLKEESEYDSKGNLLRRKNSLGRLGDALQYDDAGRLLVSRDINGIETKYVYDKAGRIISTTRDGLTTSNQYDKVGNLVKRLYPDNSSVSYEYDQSGNITKYIDMDGNITEKSYDSHDNEISNKITNKNGQVYLYTRSVYNIKDQLIKTISSSGKVTHYEYDIMGRQTKVTYPDGTSSENIYDIAGNLVKTINTEGQITEYEYDSNNNRTKAIASNGAITRYKYDTYGRLIKEDSSDRGTTSYQYSASGQLISQRDANGTVKIIKYDLLGRKIKEVFKGHSSLAADYEYDYCRVGKLCKVTDKSGSTIFNYNNNGQVIEKIQKIDTVELKTLYSYDSFDRIESMTLPSGKKVGYKYDESELVGITVDGKIFISDIEYNAAGQLKGWLWSDNTPYTRTYDTDGRILTFPLASETRMLEYNELDRIIGWSDSGSSRDKLFSYNNVGQLTSYQETEPSTGIIISQGFSYDSNGNRTYMGEKLNGYLVDNSYIIEQGSNRLSTVNQFNYQYDLNGNLLSDGVNTYQYDAANNMISVNNKHTYLYNAMGQRVKKSSDKRTVLYAWDDDRIFAEYDESGNPIQETIYLGNIPLGIIRDNNIFRIFASQENAPRVITDESGKVVWRWSSTPFGEKQPDESPDGNDFNFSYNLRYPGQYHDTETGLNYNFHRYYQPLIGRYLQSDPTGLEGGLNSYVYTDNNPITRIDINGHKYTKTITNFNIQINASIAVFGAANAAQGWNLVHTWRLGILDMWHRGGQRRYQGTRLTNLINKSVTFNVQMTYDNTATAHWQATANNGMQNAVQVLPASNTVRSYVLMPIQNGSVLPGWQGFWTANADGWVAAHEFGHMLGMDDHYSRSNPSLSCPGHGGHLMGQHHAPLHQHELNDMIDLIPGTQCS